MCMAQSRGSQALRIFFYETTLFLIYTTYYIRNKETFRATAVPHQDSDSNGNRSTVQHTERFRACPRSGRRAGAGFSNSTATC